MELYEQQLFGSTLAVAVERFRDRIVQRSEGMENALARLRADAHGEGVWLDRFVTQFFADELLDNPAGACYVLRALERRSVPAAPGGKIGDVLVDLARTAFMELLRVKTIESLEGGVAHGG